MRAKVAPKTDPMFIVKAYQRRGKLWIVFGYAGTTHTIKQAYVLAPKGWAPR